MGVDAVRRGLVGSPREAARLAAVRDALGSAVEDLRRIIDGLRPPALDELGLAGALTAQLSRLGGDTPVELDVTDPGPLSAAVEVATYHIAVEAARNALAHAQASRLVVSLRRDDETVVVQVCDDGTWRAPRGSGVGLSTMRERAEGVGGTLLVESTAAGTTVRACMPVRDPR